MRKPTFSATGELDLPEDEAGEFEPTLVHLATGEPESMITSQPQPEGGSRTESDELGYRYIVQPGDTFPHIAQRFTEAGVPVTVADIRIANNLHDFKLVVGQVLFIPINQPRSGRN
jgi:hypothetical protein